MTLVALYQRAVRLDGEAFGTQGHALVQLDVLADDGSLADDHAGAVVNEEVRPNGGAGVNVDTGEGMGIFRHHPGQHGDLHEIQLMGDAENADGFKGWVGQHDFLPAGGGGIALVGSLHVGVQRVPDGGEFGKQSVDHIVILRGFPIDPLQDLPKLTPGGRFQFFFGVGFLHGVEHIGVENGPQKIQKLDHLGFQMGVVNHGPVPPVSQMTAKGRQYRIWQDRS